MLNAAACKCWPEREGRAHITLPRSLRKSTTPAADGTLPGRAHFPHRGFIAVVQKNRYQKSVSKTAFCESNKRYAPAMHGTMYYHRTIAKGYYSMFLAPRWS